MSKFEEYKVTYKQVHGNKYNYDNSKYTKSTDKIDIYCTVHNKTFSQVARDHLRSTGCKECISELVSFGSKNRVKLDTDYLNELNKIHNNKYTYNLKGIPTKRSNKISINCPIHGEFKQRLTNHLKGMGCSKCANENKPIKNDFIERAKALELPIDYSKVNYVDMITDVTLKCMVCSHEWNCRPTYHLSYQTGCVECRKSKAGWTRSNFIERCKGNGTLYLIKLSNETEEFYKIGITSTSIDQRYKDQSSKGYYNIETIFELKSLPNKVWDKESEIKSYINKNKLRYTPIKKFAGSSTECFQINNIETILEMI